MTGFQSKKASAKDKLFDRETAVDYLTQSDFDYIMSTDDGGLELLWTYLEDGFKGYGNFSDEELVAEVEQRKAMENA